MEKLNAYFPIWILIMMPPLLFLTISFNFIMVAIGLLLVLILIDRNNIFINYTKNVLKLWGITLIVDLISFVFMVIPEFFYKNLFIKENLIKPLETNPYINIISFIYMIILFILNIVVIYNFVKKIVLNKYELDIIKKRLASFILIISMIPYIFFIPSNKIVKNNYNSLEDFRGIVLENKSKVSNIFKYLETKDYISSYVINTHAKPYTISIYLDDIDINYQEMFEKDAAVLFNLINGVDEVVFSVNKHPYKYTINTINAIFNDIKKLKLSKIYDRYKNEKFENYTYLGHINSYDIFDTSEFCDLEHQMLFAIQNNEYYLSCTDVKQILLYSKNKVINIKEALDQNLITPNDILSSTLDLVIKEVETDENIS